MPQPWSSVESNPEYQKLSVSDQDFAKSQYFSQVVSNRPDFQQLPDEDKQAAQSQFMNADQVAANNYYNDNSSSKLEKQMTAGMYEHVPFGKDMVLAADPEAAKNIARTPAPQTWDEKFGRFVGSALGLFPAITGGEALAASAVKSALEGAGELANTAIQTGDKASILKAAQIGQKVQGFASTAKLAGGAAGFGVQSGVEDTNQGASPLEAVGKGALDATIGFGAGKALNVAGDVLADIPGISQWSAARINNSIIKPQLKDLRFGRDPGGFLARNVESPDNTLQGWKSATDSAIDDKMQEAKDIISSKGDVTVNVKKAVDGIYGPAMDQAAEVGDEGLLKQLASDRDTIYNKQVVTRDPETGKLGIGSDGARDLENLPLSDAIDLKRLIGKMPTNWTQGPEYLSALQSARRQAYGSIRQATEDVAPELGRVNGDIADGISASTAMGRQMAIQQRQWMMGLYSVGGGATVLTGLWSGNLQLVASGLSIMGADAVMRSPYLASRVATVLSKVQNPVDKEALMNAVPWLKDNYNKIMSSLKNLSPNLARTTPVVNRITQHLEGTDLTGLGEQYAEPAVTRRPPEGNPFDIGGPAEGMVSEGGPAPEYVPGKEGYIGRQTLREQMAKNDQQTKNPINASDDPYGFLKDAKLNSAAAGAGTYALKATNDDNQRFKMAPAAYTKNEEGFSGSVTNDSRGRVVGYGFNSRNPSIWNMIPEDVKNGNRQLTRPEADAIYPKAYNIARNDAIQYAGNKAWNTMSPKQQQALTDMSYQMGLAKLKGFQNMRQAIQTGDWARASKEVLAGKNGGQSDYAKEVPDRARRASLMIGRSIG